jgi:hypothetical protein
MELRMTETRGPIQRYLCGGVYVAAGFAMAISAANGLYGDRPETLLQFVGGLAVAIAGGAVVRECRRQGQLDAAIGTPAPAIDRPVATVLVRGASVEDAAFRSLTEPAVLRLPASQRPDASGRRFQNAPSPV